MIPNWAVQLIREPDTLSGLDWRELEVLSETGRRFPIESGIPIFSNELDSYQNLASRRQTVDQNNPTVRAFEDRETIFDRYREYIQGKTVIDMCSGGGMPTYYLASRYACRVISIERAYSALKYYGDQFRDYYRVNDTQVVRICADAAHLPIINEAVDVVLGSSWVHHFKDQAVVLRGAYRVLKPGGLLLAHNEGVAGLLAFGTADEDQYASPDIYRRSLKAAGFTSIQVLPWSRRYSLARWIKASVDLVGIRPELTADV